MMKKILILLIIGCVVSCSSSNEGDSENKDAVAPETTKKIEDAQGANIELETMDGELDSLINLIN